MGLLTFSPGHLGLRSFCDVSCRGNIDKLHSIGALDAVLRSGAALIMSDDADRHRTAGFIRVTARF